ncbi:hypothetical protein Tco_1114113 [Tanacetum coccineum]|uniref:Uncharacterized protein n=1 Tax=Tanacetum coccineum TaxID=301880 RepID=A0ABQ5IVN4_9ASTR
MIEPCPHDYRSEIACPIGADLTVRARLYLTVEISYEQLMRLHVLRELCTSDSNAAFGKRSRMFKSCVELSFAVYTTVLPTLSRSYDLRADVLSHELSGDLSRRLVVIKYGDWLSVVLRTWGTSEVRGCQPEYEAFSSVCVAYADLFVLHVTDIAALEFLSHVESSSTFINQYFNFSGR